MRVDTTALCGALQAATSTTAVFRPTNTESSKATVPRIQKFVPLEYKSVGNVSVAKAVANLRLWIEEKEVHLKAAKEFLAEYDKGADALDLAEEDE